MLGIIFRCSFQGSMISWDLLRLDGRAVSLDLGATPLFGLILGLFDGIILAWSFCLESPIKLVRAAPVWSMPTISDVSLLRSDRLISPPSSPFNARISFSFFSASCKAWYFSFLKRSFVLADYWRTRSSGDLFDSILLMNPPVETVTLTIPLLGLFSMKSCVGVFYRKYLACWPYYMSGKISS